MELNSQRVRALAPENDPLKIGMGWKVEDLDKPAGLWLRVTFGDQDPGSAHLDQFVNEAMRGIADAGGKEPGILPQTYATALPRDMTVSTIHLRTGI